MPLFMLVMHSEAQRYYMQVVQWIVTMENPFDRRLTEPEQMGQHCAMLLSVCPRYSLANPSKPL